MAKLKFDKPTYIWKDRKRVLGMPITFIRYRIGEERLYFETGLLNTRADDILLYRVRDITMTISFWQRLTGVGTIIVDSSDKTMPTLAIRDVKHPREVKELLHRQVEKAKLAYRVRVNELMGDSPNDNPIDLDGDGVPDALQDD